MGHCMAVLSLPFSFLTHARMSDTEEGPRERLKAAIWFMVGEICENQKADLNVVITPQLVASLAEIVFNQAETLGRDLELFARHAKRSTINVDDVKLASRRNASLYGIIGQHADRLARRSKDARDARKRKK